MPEPPSSTEDMLGRFLASSGVDELAVDSDLAPDGDGDDGRRRDGTATSATLFSDREPPPDDL
jgi:hypothetical protein